MELQDALIVSAAGMFTVFFGLVVTSLLIQSFTLLPKIKEFFKKPEKAEIDSSEISKTVYPTVPPDILAVITTIIEIERRIQYTDSTSRYTFVNRQRRTSGLY